MNDNEKKAIKLLEKCLGQIDVLMYNLGDDEKLKIEEEVRDFIANLKKTN